MRQSATGAPADPQRRALLGQLALGAALVPLAMAVTREAHAAATAGAAAANLPLLQDGDPAAQATHYVSDAQRAKNAQPGANCSNCALFRSVNANGGTCSLFPSNLVSAAGWCSAWSTL